MKGFSSSQRLPEQLKRIVAPSPLFAFVGLIDQEIHSHFSEFAIPYPYQRIFNPYATNKYLLIDLQNHR